MFMTFSVGKNYVCTFISSRLAGSMPALRLEKVLLGRTVVAVGRDTTIEAGRLLVLLIATVALLFWPSITGLVSREVDGNKGKKLHLTSQKEQFSINKHHRTMERQNTTTAKINLAQEMEKEAEQ